MKRHAVNEEEDREDEKSPKYAQLYIQAKQAPASYVPGIKWVLQVSALSLGGVHVVAEGRISPFL